MQKVNQDLKLIFNVRGRPELGRAIFNRLVELGFKEPDFGPESSVNISVGWDNHGIHCGGSPADSHIFEGHTVMTLEELYDDTEWVYAPKEYILTLSGRDVVISKESFEAIKAEFDID